MSEINIVDTFNCIPLERLFSVDGFIAAYYFESFQKGKIAYWEKYNFSQIYYIFEGSIKMTTEEGASFAGKGHLLYRPAYKASMLEMQCDKSSFMILSFVCESAAMKVFEQPPFTLYGEELATLQDLIKTGTKIGEPLHSYSIKRGFRLKDDVPPVVLSFIAASMERFLSMVYCRLLNINVLLHENQKVNKFLSDRQLTASVKDYLQDNIASKLMIEDISRHLGASPTTLMKQFKADTGKSIIEYFNELKIREAKRMIRETSMNFTQISDALGYTSVNYFSKAFKGQTGLSPTQYSYMESKRGSEDCCP